MRTRCPECESILPVGTVQLRLRRGDIRCSHCGSFFNALDELLDDRETDRLILDDDSPYKNRSRTYRLIPDDEPDEARAADPAPDVDVGEPQPERDFAGRLIWGLASLALFLILAAQAGYFETDRVLKDQGLRPWFEVAASIFRQELPPYADARLIKVNGRSLHPDRSGATVSYDFSLSLTNTARIPQAFPSIKLVLTELNGNPIASRVFAPQDYLGGNRFAAEMMPVGKAQEIHLILAKPSREIGGFAFELL
ncbi:DUF3426 domain-containing protein [Candidatus Methylospira mobilis]|uniref:DUF3426 domain-containing protein n=1 Tax=Candidatus Methylospira mobilis TaxID=1808979 RepID=A0A5Q0BNW6_9GAMM|nr:zinc-ribbon and DUF3426 domain-containing protein [Candidatus Methylospira mobilis]QFY44872.1 DUF3426 domain-containing protein [Candidatus Methylospira mobilis]WNV05576.1 zinc-ribbon and DUF3426 domain-containing protein [Candidatus Methylospira mobilis]